jgi:hypothetical protein
MLCLVVHLHRQDAFNVWFTVKKIDILRVLHQGTLVPKSAYLPEPEFAQQVPIAGKKYPSASYAR